MPDIVFPNKNEKEFISIAEKLKTKELYLIYPYKKNINDYKEIINALKKQTKIKLTFGLIALHKDIPKAKNICDFVITESSEADQSTIEKLQPNLIFNFEKSDRFDKHHYRYSGLNQVLCRLATENNVILGFSFSELLNSQKQRRATILGRMIQNLKFSKQYKSPILFASFAKKPFEMRAENNLKSFSLILQKNL